MLKPFVEFLGSVEYFYWCIGIVIVIIPGIVLTIQTRFFQFRILGNLAACVRDLQECSKKEDHGIHPIKLYFSSIGGMIGIGNIVGVVTGVTIGGPGALFWLWIAVFLGMLIKYTEIYLGILYREKNDQGAYNGGPMFFLKVAFGSSTIPKIVAFLFCIYGVEIFQFVTITDTLEMTFGIHRYLIVFVLLAMIMWTALGGIKRLANICSILMPPFIISYILMCGWVIFEHIQDLPEVLRIVLYSAFNGHAAIGGFAGAGFILAIQQGVARGVYSGDIGIGFDSILQATTKTRYPERQARMAIFALATEGIVCTVTLIVVLLSGLWQEHGTNWLPSQYIPYILGQHFPFIDYYIGVLFFLAGFTTIIAYFTVGIKTAEFLSKDYGAKFYILYAVFAFIFFPCFDQTISQSLMSICAGFLITFNIMGMMRLIKMVKYK